MVQEQQQYPVYAKTVNSLFVNGITVISTFRKGDWKKSGIYSIYKHEHSKFTELNDFEALIVDGWGKQFPLLGEAYQLKEAFFGIYSSATNNVYWGYDFNPKPTLRKR